MQIGDLVKVKYPNPTSKDPHIGVIVEIMQVAAASPKQFEVIVSKFVRVCLMNGHQTIYRLDELEAVKWK